MFIDKFKREDGQYYAEGSDEYSEGFDAIEFIHINLFGFCGCGSAEDNLKYIRDSMRLLKDKKYHNAESLAHFKSEASEDFMWYWLDEKRLTDHGFCIPGWLTEYGEGLLEDLEELLK